MNYQDTAQMLKALADPKRLKIIDLLSCGTLCACDILPHFDFTQPTLSYHMKALEKAGIVTVTKDGLWHHYQLTESFVTEFMKVMTQLFSISDDCVCTSNKCMRREENAEEMNSV